jgi:hypothetical protein
MIYVLLDVLLAASGLKGRQYIGGRYGDDSSSLSDILLVAVAASSLGRIWAAMIHVLLGVLLAAMIHVLLDVLLAAYGLKRRQNIGGRYGDDSSSLSDGHVIVFSCF